MSRIDNIEIFQDTVKLCKSKDVLKNAIKKATREQKLILETDEVHVPSREKYKNPAKVLVSKKRSFEAASEYKEQQVCVHNFASATNPGGGVVKGSSAQEECLCRCSTLYMSLNTPSMWEGFYTPHRNIQNPIHNDDCIYTPEVVVLKTDTATPELLPEAEWYKVNVISCAAPNLREKPANAMNAGDGFKKVTITDDKLQAIHEKRLERILDIALNEGNEVVILGAFGCGAFENKPEVVAKAAKKVIQKYQYAFKTIEFAVYCSPKDETNYKTFYSVIKDSYKKKLKTNYIL